MSVLGTQIQLPQDLNPTLRGDLSSLFPNDFLMWGEPSLEAGCDVMNVRVHTAEPSPPVLCLPTEQQYLHRNPDTYCP